MKGFTGLLLPAALLALVACEGHSSKIEVQDLSAGRYIVGVGSAEAPTVGQYYAAADGSRLLVLADADEHASQLYRRAAGDAWVGVPSNEDVKIDLLSQSAEPAATVEPATLAGRYVAQTAAGVVANFSIEADGDIVAGASACKLSGKLSAGVLPGTLKLLLSATGCGALPANASGVLAVDADYAPAEFRLIADDGALLIDLWAYRE